MRILPSVPMVPYEPLSHTGKYLDRHSSERQKPLLQNSKTPSAAGTMPLLRKPPDFHKNLIAPKCRRPELTLSCIYHLQTLFSTQRPLSARILDIMRKVVYESPSFKLNHPLYNARHGNIHFSNAREKESPPTSYFLLSSSTEISVT